MSDDIFDFDFDFDLDFSGGSQTDSSPVSQALVKLANNQPGEALPFIERAKSETGDTPLVRHLTALTLARMGRVVPAIRILETAHAKSPNAFEHAEVLAALFALVGERVESVYYAKLSSALKKEYPEYALVPEWLVSFGVSFMMAEENPLADNAVLLMNDGDYDAAAENFIDAIDLNSSDVRAWQGLVDVNKKRRRPGDSLRAAEALAAVEEDNADHLRELCSCQLDLGLTEQAWETANRALTAAGPDPEIARMLPALVRYDGSAPTELGVQLSHAWYNLLNVSPQPLTVTPRQNEIERFRVGILSGQIRSGTERVAVLSTVEECIGRAAELHYYSNVQSEDSVSRRLRRAAVRWRNISRMDDDTVAEIIRNDEIQILIDLDGFGWTGRPGVTARRPAPVVLCAFGQPGALPGDHPMIMALGEPGLPGYEGNADRTVQIPQGLSTWPLYVKPSGEQDRPRTGRILIDGPVGRISGQFAMDLSRAVKEGMSGSIVLRGDDPEDAIALEHLVQRFADAGLDISNIERISGHMPLDQVLATVDLLVDTWPVPSTEAAFSALRYGLPVVTRAPENPANATVSSLLASLGLQELIADGRDAFAGLLVRLTSNDGELEATRSRIAQALDVASGLDVRLQRGRAFAALFDELLEKAKAEQK
ncbi:MAG: hypothetical protein RIM33_08410 [Alphaproteobacteria bacterium]